MLKRPLASAWAGGRPRLHGTASQTCSGAAAAEGISAPQRPGLAGRPQASLEPCHSALHAQHGKPSSVHLLLLPFSMASNNQASLETLPLSAARSAWQAFPCPLLLTSHLHCPPLESSPKVCP